MIGNLENIKEIDQKAREDREMELARKASLQENSKKDKKERGRVRLGFDPLMDRLDGIYNDSPEKKKPKKKKTPAAATVTSGALDQATNVSCLSLLIFVVVRTLLQIPSYSIHI